jgi:hypothetical protein
VGARELPLLWKFSFLFSLLFAHFAQAELPKGIQFKADYYQRDLSANLIRGKGNAWVKSDDQEVWSDEVEVDFATHRAVASGHVRMKRGPVQVWSDRAEFNLKGPDAVFEKATLTSNSLIVTGETIRRFDFRNFEVEEGSYTNCNTTLIASPKVGDCSMDWRISGRRFRITMEGYAHFYDVIVNAKNIPILYTPYLIIPVKHERQSGILMPSFPFSATLGSGIAVPVYLALGAWHDLLVTPTYYSSTGLHLGLNYRYIYEPGREGMADIYLLSRRFSGPSNPGPDDSSRSRFLGLFGEAGVRLHNLYRLSNSRAHSRQMINYVSNPFFSFDYSGNVGPRADLGNLRSQITYSRPGDQWFLGGQVQYLQSLVVSRDSGIDRGAVGQLPVLTAAKATTPLLGQILSYEFDSQFSNFSRTTAFDQLPTSPAAGITSSIPNPVYLRAGRRLQLEPRLLVNVPMPPGFQFQPLVKAGSLLYHFDYPTSSVAHREYVDFEVPVGIQLSKLYTTSIRGFEKVSHVFQPRVVFASSLLQTGGDDHTFFFRDTASGLSNPRFDITDQITPFQYMRFELINRFRRKTSEGSAERFFWFQLSEQYNVRTSSIDPRYTTALGPIELFSSLTLGSYSIELQGSYPLQETTSLNGSPLTTPVAEAFLSTGISYRGPGKTVFSLNGLYRKSADPGLNAQIGTFHFYKDLPTFFDIEGYLEYNFLTKELYGYYVSFHFRSKPRSCWSFSLTTGQNAFRTQFANIGFALDFGTADGV